MASPKTLATRTYQWLPRSKWPSAKKPLKGKKNLSAYGGNFKTVGQFK